MTTLLLPLGFVLGLALIPLEIWRAGRRALAGRPPPEWPTVDLRRASVRLTIVFIAALTAVNLAIVVMASYKGVEDMDSTVFCEVAWEDYASLTQSRTASPGVQFTDPSRNWLLDYAGTVRNVDATLEVAELAPRTDLGVSLIGATSPTSTQMSSCRAPRCRPRRSWPPSSTSCSARRWT